MPACFDIVASTGSYAVAIEPGLLEATLAGPGDRVFIVDEFLAGPLIEAGLDPIVIAASEQAKSLDQMTDLIVAMRDRGTTRGTTLVAIGGGVIQDAAAFAASIFMRGISWIYVPTTLLSMTDSCIGGKSSINVGKYKNIVGTFHPPEQVVIDPKLTGTLSAEQKAAGLCEAVKICLCHGPDTLDRYLALAPSISADAATMSEIVALSLQTKKWFIEIDEFDRAERLLLNFGHTFGHALEAASAFRVSHGIAVGLGMLAALHLGQAMGRDYSGFPHIAAFRSHVAELIGSVDGLSEALRELSVPALMDAFSSDKKHSRSHFVVIMVAGDGSVERRALPRDPASVALLEEAFRRMLRDWSPAQPSQSDGGIADAPLVQSEWHR
jgi:3-dehydroquinate synthase